MTMPRHIQLGRTAAYFVVVIVATIVAGVAIYQAKKSHDVASDSRRVAIQTRNVAVANAFLIEQLRLQKASIQSLRTAERNSCANFETLKGAVNRFHGTLRTFLAQALERQQKLLEHPEQLSPAQLSSAQLAAKQIAELLANTRTVTASCAQKINAN